MNVNRELGTIKNVNFRTSVTEMKILLVCIEEEIENSRSVSELERKISRKYPRKKLT